LAEKSANCPRLSSSTPSIGVSSKFRRPSHSPSMFTAGKRRRQRPEAITWRALNVWCGWSK